MVDVIEVTCVLGVVKQLCLCLVLELPRQVAASVLAEVDLQGLVVFERLDAVDGFDGVGNIDKINEGTVFVFQIVDLLNLSKRGEVLPQLSRIEVRKVVDVADVDVSRRTVGHCQRQGIRKWTGVFSPANFDSSVVDGQPVELTHGKESGCSNGVDESNEANVSFLQVANASQQAASDHIANLLHGRLSMQIAEIDGSVAQVVGTASLSGDLSSSSRLLHQSCRDEFSVCRCHNVLHAGSQTQISSSIMSLSFGDEGTSVLSVETLLVQVLVLQRQVRDTSDGTQNGQEVNESNTLLVDDLDAVDDSVHQKVFPQLFLGDHVASSWVMQVAQVHISGGTVLLDGLFDGWENVGVLAPTDSDVVTLDVQLFQDTVRVEQQG